MEKRDFQKELGLRRNLEGSERGSVVDEVESLRVIGEGKGGGC